MDAETCGGKRCNNRRDLDKRRAKAEARRQVAEAESAAPSEPAGSEPERTAFNTYEEEHARRERQLADLAELEVAKRRGQLVEVKGLEQRWAAKVAAARAHMLAVVTRIRQQMPEVTTEQAQKIGEFIQEAMVEVAG